MRRRTTSLETPLPKLVSLETPLPKLVEQCSDHTEYLGLSERLSASCAGSRTSPSRLSPGQSESLRTGIRRSKLLA
jgi:hypothetical protein